MDNDKWEAATAHSYQCSCPYTQTQAQQGNGKKNHLTPNEKAIKVRAKIQRQ